MQREILFRGFHECDDGTEQIQIDSKVIKGKWVDGDLVGNDSKYFIVYDKDSYEETTCGIKKLIHDRYFEIIPETVCQYTGLKDKNGRKIFEGDRVVGDIGNGLLPVKRLLRRIGIVEYVRSAFVLKIINRFGVNDKGENDFCGEKVSFGAFGNAEIIGTKFDICNYKKPDGLCLRESDDENNIYCVEGPCDEIIGNIFEVRE